MTTDYKKSSVYEFFIPTTVRDSKLGESLVATVTIDNSSGRAFAEIPHNEFESVADLVNFYRLLAGKIEMETK